MKLFAIICLAVILIVIQHLLNWMWRNAKEEKFETGAFLITLFAGAITVYGFITLSRWIMEFHFGL